MYVSASSDCVFVTAVYSRLGNALGSEPSQLQHREMTAIATGMTGLCLYSDVKTKRAAHKLNIVYQMLCFSICKCTRVS